MKPEGRKNKSAREETHRHLSSLPPGQTPREGPPRGRKMTTHVLLRAARGALAGSHRAPREGSATLDPRPFSLPEVWVWRRRGASGTQPKGSLPHANTWGAGWAEPEPEPGEAQHGWGEVGARTELWGALRPHGDWQGRGGTLQRKQRRHGLRAGGKPDILRVRSAGPQHQGPLGGRGSEERNGPAGHH